MRKMWSILLFAVCGTVLWAEPGRTDTAPAREKTARNSGFNRFYWRAFSRMTQEERKAMMELQAKDPAEFHRKMREAMEALRAADAARRKQIAALAERCRTGSEEEKQAARKELTEIFRKGYTKRLADSRRHLQEMEARMKRLSETLKKKEANADAEIEMMVENCIRGIKPPRPERHGRPFPGPGK